MLRRNLTEIGKAVKNAKLSCIREVGYKRTVANTATNEKQIVTNGAYQ
jgi:hypothetical protein